MRKPGRAVLCALVAAIIGAGCGGAEEEKPLSKADYIAKGDASCKKSIKRIATAAEKDFGALGSDEMPSDKQLTTFVEDTLKPEIAGQVSDLRDLEPPEGDGDKLAEIYEGVDEALRKVEDDPGLLLKAGEDPFEKAYEAVRDYGFKECGES